MNLYLRAFSIAIYQKFNLYYLCLFKLFSDLQIVQVWSVNYGLFQTILDLWLVLMLEMFSCWDIKRGPFQFLVSFLVVFFWSVNCTKQVCISSYVLNMGNSLFEGF